MIQFIVHGKPQPAGSKRSFPFQRKDGNLGVRVTDANPNAKHWQQQVACSARAEHSGDLLEGPLRLMVVFVMPRPKGHFKKNGGLRSSAPEHPAVRPDVLKLTRAVEDALTGVLWHDDAQIVQEVLDKRYGQTAHTIVCVTEPEEDHLAWLLDLAKKELTTKSNR